MALCVTFKGEAESIPAPGEDDSTLDNTDDYWKFLKVLNIHLANFFDALLNKNISQDFNGDYGKWNVFLTNLLLFLNVIPEEKKNSEIRSLQVTIGEL